MNELLTTNVSEVAAVHLTMSLTCNPAAKRDMTLIWHTGLTWCEPGDRSHDSIAWPDPPMVWEVSPGDFEPVDTVQCSHCGGRYGTLARIYEGHLDPDEIMDLATYIGDGVEEGRDRARRRIQLRLEADLKSALTDEDYPLNEDETTPGVYKPAGEMSLVAWEYDPWLEDEMIEAVHA